MYPATGRGSLASGWTGTRAQVSSNVVESPTCVQCCTRYSEDIFRVAHKLPVHYLISCEIFGSAFMFWSTLPTFFWRWHMSVTRFIFNLRQVHWSGIRWNWGSQDSLVKRIRQQTVELFAVYAYRGFLLNCRVYFWVFKLHFLTCVRRAHRTERLEGREPHVRTHRKGCLRPRRS